jgi:uncharacterized membrane protein YkoI
MNATRNVSAAFFAVALALAGCGSGNEATTTVTPAEPTSAPGAAPPAASPSATEEPEPTPTPVEGQLTAEEAGAIAQDAVGGGRVTEASLDFKDGTIVVWEVKVDTDAGQVWEVSVERMTGEVLETELDDPDPEAASG